MITVLLVSINRALQKTAQADKAVGKSRGDLTTKIHAAVDAFGNPVRLTLTESQASEYRQANALTKNFSADYILTDKSYNSEAFILSICSSGAKPLIPPGKERVQPRFYDQELYKERNLVERLFQKLKPFRRVAKQYERLGRNYLGMLQLTASLIWLT
ncbi:hypothetical protein CI610_01178 [invertebrate metagenome]|uniref:Transposase IS4-like domain-containing protein n=1 Tax=invertebrate metagenome TaxID=1711999 RepID=A0A2H9T9B7_9ZZZZ